MVTEWDEGSGLSFALVRAPFPMKNARENMHIEQRGSMVRIHSKVTYGMQLGLLGAWLDRLLVSRLVSRDMRNSLAGLKELLEGVPIPDGNTKPAIESSFR